MSADAFSRALDAFGTQVADLPDKAAALVADAVRDEAAARSPVRTGRLQSGWSVDSGAGAVARVINDVPYAAVVEYGARGRLGVAMARSAASVVAARLDDLLAEIAP